LVKLGRQRIDGSGTRLMLRTLGLLAIRQLLHADHALLEDQHRLGHHPQFVPAPGARDLDAVVALGQAPHHAGQTNDRPRQTTTDEPGQQQTDNRTADAQRQHHERHGTEQSGRLLLDELLRFPGTVVDGLGCLRHRRAGLQQLAADELVQLATQRGVALEDLAVLQAEGLELLDVRAIRTLPRGLIELVEDPLQLPQAHLGSDTGSGHTARHERVGVQPNLRQVRQHRLTDGDGTGVAILCRGHHQCVEPIAQLRTHCLQTIGDCRILCLQRGYPFETGTIGRMAVGELAHVGQLVGAPNQRQPALDPRAEGVLQLLHGLPLSGIARNGERAHALVQLRGVTVHLCDQAGNGNALLELLDPCGDALEHQHAAAAHQQQQQQDTAEPGHDAGAQSKATEAEKHVNDRHPGHGSHPHGQDTGESGRGSTSQPSPRYRAVTPNV
jgi:hypothetical protein